MTTETEPMVRVVSVRIISACHHEFDDPLIFDHISKRWVGSGDLATVQEVRRIAGKALCAQCDTLLETLIATEPVR